MEEVRHKTAKSWFDAIETANGHELLVGDVPTRRSLGFFDHTDEKHHLIGLTLMDVTFSDYLDQFPKDRREAVSHSVREYLKTPESRKKLIESRA
jgi:hypothetical protein